MSTGYRDKNKKFHPIDKTRKVRYSGTRKVSLGVKLGKPKPPASKIKAEINTDIAFRKRLFNENELLLQKIEEGGDSPFNRDRREQFNKNREIIKDVEKSIKKNIKRLDKEDRATLPTEIKNEVRTFRWKALPETKNSFQ